MLVFTGKKTTPVGSLSAWHHGVNVNPGERTGWTRLHASLLTCIRWDEDGPVPLPRALQHRDGPVGYTALPAAREGFWGRFCHRWATAVQSGHVLFFFFYGAFCGRAVAAGLAELLAPPGAFGDVLEPSPTQP